MPPLSRFPAGRSQWKDSRGFHFLGAFLAAPTSPREPNVGFEIMDGVAVGDFLRVRLDIRKKKPSCGVRTCRCAACG